ncbi:MAG: hypothetical protein A3J83_03550 [Elusimicrobia bacterium RIFOXYA2_FULL_40_6]|nr:MAG: hypothetical protein A3J83_03550 [Elusimicrobia bacterium RIFOXYA2_FULL_40_6]
MGQNLLNIDEAAEFLKMKKWTIYAWISQKKIPFIKCGRLVRFDIDVLSKWLQGNSFNPIPNKHRV